MNAGLEQLDADTILDRWLTDRLDFDVPCDVNPSHAAADWIRKTRVCNCAVLMCEPCRAEFLDAAPTACWPRVCHRCKAIVGGPELIFFVPLREAPVS